jgi:hypothetical protein
MWNSCRAFTVGCGSTGICSSAANGNEFTYVPASDQISRDYVAHITNPNLTFNSTTGEPILLCADTNADNLPAIFLDINGNPIPDVHSMYSPGSVAGVAYPYFGNADDSIYKYDALEFTVEFINGNPKLKVDTTQTDLIADILGANSSDINNDGIDDFYSSLGCEWQGCISSGSNIDNNNDDTSNGAYFDNLGEHTSIFYDYIETFNGDATGTNYNSKIQEFKQSIKHQSSYAVNKVTSVMPDMLVSVTKPYASSSYNTKVEWSYNALSTPVSDRPDFPLYTVPKRDSGDSYVDEPGVAGDHFYFNSSMYVVSQMRQTNNYGNDAVTQYAYEEAVYNNKGRGFQGFRKISVRSRPDDSAQGLVYETLSESTFHQVFPYAGKLEKIEVYQQGAKTQQENYTYAQTNLSNNSANGVVYYPLTNKVSQNFELNNGNAVSESTTTIPATSYDDYGNITNQTTTLVSHLPNSKTRQETTTTTNVYDPADINNWWVDKLSKTTVAKSVTDDRAGSPASFATHTTHSKFFWQASSARKLACQYTYIGANPTDCTDPITDENISRNSFNYDTNGNITGVTTTAYDPIYASAKSRSVSTSYTTDGYFPSQITKAGLICFDLSSLTA